MLSDFSLLFTLNIVHNFNIINSEGSSIKANFFNHFHRKIFDRATINTSSRIFIKKKRIESSNKQKNCVKVNTQLLKAQLQLQL